MSASNEWTEWHLTARGWEEGSTRIDGSPIKHLSPPSDRVLTCKYYEYLSSPFSQFDKGVKEIWRSSEEQLIADLLEKYGLCPEKL